MEKKKKYNQASLLLHALIDNLDDSHFRYDKDEGILEFNVGKVARNSKFSYIDFIIKRDDNELIKPAKRKTNDQYAVVIKTSDFPDINDVDDFLESSNISADVIEALSTIINRVPPMDDDENDMSRKTGYEKEKYFNKREVFEEIYQQAAKRMKEKLEEFKKAKQQFEDKIENSGIASRKATYKLAIDNLKKEMIGQNASQFKSKFMSVLDEINPEFKDNLDSENRKRLNSRIEQFYSEID